MNTLRAEWTKLLTTRSFLVTTAVYLLMSVGLAGLVGYGTASAARTIDGADADGLALLSGGGLLVGVAQALPVLLIQAIFMVTSEYNSNLASVTFSATPQRWVVAVAKYLLHAGIAFLIIVVSIILALFVGRAAAGDLGAGVALWEDPFVQRQMWALPIGGLVLFAMGMGVAWIIRSTAGAMALMLLWWTILENVLFSLIPVAGRFASYGPMTNLRAFLDAQPINGAPWGVGGSLAYGVLWALAAMIAGVVVLHRRDV